MNAKTEKRLAILRAIRDGEKFSKANKILAPLGQAGLIEVEYEDELVGGRLMKTKIKSVKLSPYGASYLRVVEKENKT